MELPTVQARVLGFTKWEDALDANLGWVVKEKEISQGSIISLSLCVCIYLSLCMCVCVSLSLYLSVDVSDYIVTPTMWLQASSLYPGPQKNKEHLR